jgi:hypothetical protein
MSLDKSEEISRISGCVIKCLSCLMERLSSNSIVDSEIYKRPEEALDKLVNSLDLPKEIAPAFYTYYDEIKNAENPKDDYYQDLVSPILDFLLSKGRNRESGLIFNLHRTLTQFRGYGANESASSDVDTMFDDKFEIPKRGNIVIDQFVVRNLPAVVRLCQQRGIDLRRIKVRAPEAIFAAQLMGMSPDKRAEFEDACAQLDKKQFLIKNVGHVHEIDVPGKIALLLSPRTLPIYPEIHKSTESATISKYRNWVSKMASKTVKGGRMLINTTIVEEFRPAHVERSQGKRNLAKISQAVSDNVARAMSDEFENYDFNILDGENFGPLDGYDHDKIVKGFHIQKKSHFKIGGLIKKFKRKAKRVLSKFSI